MSNVGERTPGHTSGRGGPGLSPRHGSSVERSEDCDAGSSGNPPRGSTSGPSTDPNRMPSSQPVLPPQYTNEAIQSMLRQATQLQASIASNPIPTTQNLQAILKWIDVYDNILTISKLPQERFDDNAPLSQVSALYSAAVTCTTDKRQPPRDKREKMIKSRQHRLILEQQLDLLKKAAHAGIDDDRDQFRMIMTQQMRSVPSCRGRTA